MHSSISYLSNYDLLANGDASSTQFVGFAFIQIESL